jgi:FAD/FMN-containing dehydrogenase
MGLLVDRAFVDAATSVPALREMIRDALIEALFTRNDRVLPSKIVAVLGRRPSVTLKPKTDAEVQKIVRVANGQESTVSLGLPAEDYHYIRRQLSVSKDQDVGIYLRTRALTTHPWIVPPQGGIELDVSDLSGVEVAEAGNQALVGVGARWKALYDEAARAGRLVPFFPVVPLDYAIGDALYGDAVFQSYSAPFSRFLLAIRSIASHGRKARLGFEEVTNHGTGYDLLGLLQDSLSEFVVPVSAAVALAPRPKTLRNLAYHFADAGRLAEALGRLTASGRSLVYANVYDAGAWGLVHPGAAGGPLSLEVGVAGSSSVAPVREKGLDALLAGFTAKASDLPAPYDADARAYARTAERIGALMIPGYVTVPVKSLPDLMGKLRGIEEVAAAKASVFGAVRQNGTVTIAPCFAAPKEPPKVYGISRTLWGIVRAIPGATYNSRLAHLWSEDKMYRTRLSVLQKLKTEIDSARVVEPTVPVG